MTVIAYTKGVMCADKRTSINARNKLLDQLTEPV